MFHRIENINRIRRFSTSTRYQRQKLQPILIEGPDRRGVDVGLLYNPSFFTPTNVVSHRLQSSVPILFRDQLCNGDLADEQIHRIIVSLFLNAVAKHVLAPRRKDAAVPNGFVIVFKIRPEAKSVLWVT